MKAIKEQIPQRATESFFAYHFEGEEFGAPYHFHPEIELVYIEAGKGTRVIGDDTASFFPGELCLFGTNLPHFYHADEASPEPASLVVQFLPELIEPLMDSPEMQPVHKMISASSRGLRFHGFDADWAVSSIERLIEERGPGRIVLLLDVLAKLSALPNVEPIATLGFQWDANASQQARIEAVWQRLMSSFGEDITQAQIASEVHMSVSAFSRFFRRAANMSFTDALIEIRLGHACRLLLEDEKNVSEICFESGFKNLSNFNRLFKKRYNCTPREWRRRLESSSAG